MQIAHMPERDIMYDIIIIPYGAHRYFRGPQVSKMIYFPQRSLRNFARFWLNIWMKLVEQTLMYPKGQVNNFSLDGFGRNDHEKSC